MAKKYYTAEEIERARAIPLYEYLQSRHPDLLERVTPTEYKLTTHDSLRVKTNGKWYWWSRKIGGYSALDYLVKVEGMEFLDAMAELHDGGVIYTPAPREKTIEERAFELPEKNESNKTAIRYLKSRRIDADIINYCISDGSIYETARYHNVAFVGFDEHGDAKYTALRGCFASPFKGEARGSDKRYAFSLLSGQENLVVFEGAIDALSYATLLKSVNPNKWREYSYLSLGGAVETQNDRLPAALEEYLKTHTGTKSVLLALDNDNTGRAAAKALKRLLSDKYTTRFELPPKGKDWNEYLQSFFERKNTKEEVER